MIPSVAASEMGIAQTNLRIGVVGLDFGVTKLIYSRTLLGSRAIEGDSPVCEIY